MATVQDAITRIQLFKLELQSQMPAISKDVAGVFVSEKKTQIRTSGIGSYSPTLYSAHYLRGKELNSTGKSFLDMKIKNAERTNWAQLRNAQGLQIAFVDVFYSGQMLNNTGVIRFNNSSSRYVSIIGGGDDESKRKLYLNYLRYKGFLYPTPEQGINIGTRSIFLVGEIYKRILKL